MRSFVTIGGAAADSAVAPKRAAAAMALTWLSCLCLVANLRPDIALLKKTNR